MTDAIRFPFDAKKAAQVTALLVEKKGGNLNYLHAIKMLYAIDRVALEKWGEPVIGGHYCSMSKGPVISEIFDLVKGRVTRPEWSQYLRTSDYDLVLRKAAGTSELSRAETDLIETVFAMYGHRDKWAIVEEMHDQFKEWEDPGRSSTPIAVEAILKAVNKNSDEIEQIAKDSSYYNRIKAALGR